METLQQPRRWALALRRGLGRVAEPHVLLPAIAILVLALIWGTTLNLVKVERAAAEHAAAVSSSELAETYESQVLRVLREIDQTLKFVKYAYELRGKQVVLHELKARALLPSDLLFVVSIADSKGDIVASTRPSAPANVAAEDYFRSQLQTDGLSVGAPRKSPGSGENKLQFSRRLNAADGTFAGIAVVSVDAAYFVSVYESAKLGQHGVLGVLGTDGVFRARRTGDTVSAGDQVEYSAVVDAENQAESKATLSTNAWDGVRRYTSARQLYGFPLAVVVGLSADEQLAATRRDTHAYLWRASAGSFLLLLIVSVLGRMSRQLALSRQRAVDEHIAHAARVEYLAFHDGLTTLPNRRLFSKLLAQSITQAHRYNRQLAVLFLDLDGFKHVNDTLGHEAGDQLLLGVATRLKACLRESDTIARLGGDEFVVLLPELLEEKCVAAVARKILSAVAQPYVLLGGEARVTASVGISIYPRDGPDEETLTKNADAAMYQAKNEGKNNFKFYSKKLDDDSLERLTLESGLRNALRKNEFRLHYQAQRDTRSGRITGMEVLLRWQRPDLGTVAPMKFIPLAEETGLIVPIGKWVLETACLQNVAWQNQGLPRLVIAVNLTPRQFFDEHLLTDLGAILAASGMEAQLLELEIAESLLMGDAGKTVRVLSALKAMGIRIAVDNFGIGYASLAMLRQFPLDTVKIDRSFSRISRDGPDKDLTEAVVAMGKALSLKVVAQGVETKEQADFFRDNACDEYQGFYFNNPLPAEQIAQLLRSQPGIAAGAALPVA